MPVLANSAATPTTARRPFSALEDPKQLADHLRTTQPVRWDKFHTNKPRILIVDDNPRTLDRMVTAIYELYGVLPDRANHGYRAERQVREAKESGSPYQLMITDLHMPEITGMDLTKSLGADCPPTIWHTASSMNDELANLTVQMDRYQATNAMALLNEHVVEKRPAGLPLAAIFIALKDQPLTSLVNQIDAALLIQEQNPGCASLNSEFLKIYEPTLIPPDLTSKSVHEILEEFRNASLLIEPLISKLGELGLAVNSWWLKNQKIVEGALEAMRAAHFRSIPLESTELAWDTIHNLLGEFQNLNPSGLEFNNNAEASKFVRHWEESFFQYREILSNLGNNLRAYTRGEIDLHGLVKDAAEKTELHFSCPTAFGRDLPLFPDKERRVRTLVGAMVARFQDRMAASTEYGHVTLEFSSEADRIVTENKAPKALKAGDYYSLTFSHGVLEKYDATFESLAGSLFELRQAGIIGWTQEVETGDYGSAHFTLYIKRSEQQIDFQSYLDRTTKLAAAPTEILPQLNGKKNVPIFSVEGAACIGRLPGELDYRCVTGKADSAYGLVYEYGDRTYFASGNSHKEAAAVINEFLRIKSSALDAEHALTADEIYADGTRVSLVSNSRIHLEARSGPQNSEQNAECLIKLGALADRVVISNKHFPHRKSLRDTFSDLFLEFKKEAQDKFRADIEHCLGGLSRSPLGAQTINDYCSIMSGEIPCSEPSFIIRTREPVSLQQQQAIATYIERVLEQIRSPSFGRDDYGDFVQINGECARKSGMYFYDPDYESRYDEFSGGRDIKHLRPFISQSQTHRLGREKITSVLGTPLPKGAFIYGGGDHEISMVDSQARLGCALELALQDLKIPYDVARAKSDNLDFYFHFNGAELQPQDDVRMMF